MSNVWNSIKTNLQELNLSITLACGQSFRWKQNKAGDWVGVLAGHVVALKQDTSGNLLYKVLSAPKNYFNEQFSTYEASQYKQKIKSNKIKRERNVRERTKKKNDINVINDTIASRSQCEFILQDYFQLHIPLSDLYKQWSDADTNFAKIAEKFHGVRILRQYPVENLISFICSSNNNISRITTMVEKLCIKYGYKLCEIEEQSFYEFPTLDQLAGKQVEEELRNSGFGYRAKYINQTAKFITENKPPGWLESLRNVPYEEAHSSLIQLPGVGAKVADCVCLMSLDKFQAIPVDTHVWQIAVRDYLPHLKTTKSLTDKSYKDIGNFFRKLFGEYAGWAHSVLFSADLRKFKHLSA